MGALMMGSLIGFSGCKKKEIVEEPPEQTPSATPTSKPATPEPKPVAVTTPTPRAATPAPELAPPGVFYLVTAVSVETSDGILGLKPGQLLREVRPGVYRADNNELTLRPEQVTNDLAIARRFAVQDQKTQAAIRQQLAAPGGASKPAVASAQSRPSAPPTPPPDDAATAARKELLRQRDALQLQANQVAVSLNQASSKYGPWAVAAKKSPQAFQLLQQFNAIQGQINELNGQISQIR